MRVEYDITPDDILAFQLHLAGTSKVLRRMWRKMIALACVLLVIVALPTLLHFELPQECLVSMYILALFLFLFVLLASVMRKSNIRRYVTRLLSAGRNRCMLGPCTLETTPEHVQQKAEYWEMTIRWGGFESFAAETDYAYLMTGTASALVVPRRAFRDDREWYEFIESARSNIAAAATGQQTSGVPG